MMFVAHFAGFGSKVYEMDLKFIAARHDEAVKLHNALHKAPEN